MNITIESTINATLSKVWELYTQPEHIQNWNFASDDWCCPSASNDLQIGGKLISRMEAKDGSIGFDFEGIYTNVIDQEYLTYKLEDGREVEVQFQAENDTTTMTIIFDVETQNPVEIQKQGWQAILDNFKKYAEK